MNAKMQEQDKLLKLLTNMSFLKIPTIITVFTVACSISCTAQPQATMTKVIEEENPEFEVATFGAGCFWCVEAVFEKLEGVQTVESGYTGGHVKDPTYKQVCTGTTGHAEVARILFDPRAISYETLLAWLWRSHDPTLLNRQGADVGPHYRSAIFYHSAEQKELAEASKEEAQSMFNSPIVTEITKASTFYIAENYHQDYFRQNPSAPFCQFVIQPKLGKLGLD